MIKRVVILTAGALAATSLVSCRDSLPTYLLSQGLQQGALYMGARPVEEVLNDPTSDPVVKRYLALSRDVLEFASTQLGMNTKGNYRSYAALKRRWVSYVVVAAERDRLQAHLFEYPFFGGLPYRGYFKLGDANDFAKRLRTQGLDVHVRPVPAYSTTGWLPDPIVTSMFASEVDFIEVLFHELVHVQFYVSGEADFNEAFATWFAHKATERFIRERAFSNEERARLLAELSASQNRDLVRTQWIHRVLAQARDFYASPSFKNATDSERAHLRQGLFAEISSQLSKVEGLEKWAAIEWNNAVLVSLSTYHDLVAGIDAYSMARGLSPADLLRATQENASPILSELKRPLDSACRNSVSRNPLDPRESSELSECPSDSARRRPQPSAELSSREP